MSTEKSELDKNDTITLEVVNSLDCNIDLKMENSDGLLSELSYKKKKDIKCCNKSIKKETLLLLLTILGVVMGVLVGLTVRLANPSDEAITLISIPGELFMRMLKMLIIPVIFTSVVTGLAKLNCRESGRIWFHCFLYYVTTTLFAAVLGIVLVSTIQPGKSTQTDDTNMYFTEKEDTVISTLDSFLDLLRNLFMDNIIEGCFRVTQTRLTEVRQQNVKRADTDNSSSAYGAIAKDGANYTEYAKVLAKVDAPNILGIMLLAIMFGIALSTHRNKAKNVAEFMESINIIFMSLIMIVLWLSPIGICSLIAGNFLEMKSIIDLLSMLGLYMVTVISGLLIHVFIFLPLLYFIFIRRNPFKMYFEVIEATLIAFGLSSSSAALPVSLKCLENNMGINKRITRFMLPLGATMNMDGTALMESVAAITIAQMYGVPLTPGQIVTISLTTTLTSIGAATIPSAGLVALLIVLNAIGLPTEPVGLLWTIDWFLDRLRTPVNVIGDCVGTCIVAHLNKPTIL